MKQFYEEVQAGTLWVNDPLTDNDAGPFGGMKMSGLGRELGEEGLDEFRETKHLHWDFDRREAVVVPLWPLTLPKRRVLGSTTQLPPRLPDGSARAVLCSWRRCDPCASSFRTPSTHASGRIDPSGPSHHSLSTAGW